MSFGYSFGDFVAGANLSYRLIRALSETRGASLEYQEAINELASMQHTFLQVGQMRPSSTLSRATINAASYIVLSSVNLIAEFLEKTKKYREQFCGSRTGNSVSDGWRKMGWVLFKSDELKALRDSLHVKMTNIALLLSTAHFHGNIPSHIAAFEVDHFPKSSEELLPAYSNLPSSLTDSLTSASREYIKPTCVDEENCDNVQFATTKTFQEAPSQIQAKEQHVETNLNNAISSPPSLLNTEGSSNAGLLRRSQSYEEKLDDKINRKAEVYQVNDFEDTVEMSKKETPINSAAALARGDTEPITSGRVEVLTRLEQFLKSDEVNSKEADLFKRLETALQKREAQSGRSNPKPVSKPIRFKDAVGRKFSFPFNLCKTWAGMEELIRQAFMHVEVIGPHVAEGHYDLVGPNGEIILPQVWETMIEPDWAITMHMWPIPEAPKGPPENVTVIDADPRMNCPPPRRRVPPPGWIRPPPSCGVDEVIVIEDNTSISPKRKSKKRRGILKGLFNGKKWKSNTSDTETDSDNDW